MADEPNVRQRFSTAGDRGSKSEMDPGTKPNSVQKDVNLQRIRDLTQKLRTDLMNQLGRQLTDLLEDFTQEVEAIEQSVNMANGTDGTRRKVKGSLPDKEFIARRSVLTELLEISHIRTIYHIFVAILIVFSLNTIVYDFMEHGKLVLDFNIIMWAFGSFPTVITLWVCMTFSTVLIVYPLFQYWAYNRRPGKPGWQDLVWFTLYVIYQTLFMALPVRILYRHQLPSASTVIIVCEQIRLLMKSHAFVRENMVRAVNWEKHKPGEGGPTLPCPGFSKYLYFLFAPTLVYRDQYPRTPSIRWNYVVSNFVQVLACLFYTYYIFARFCVPVFRNFSEAHVTPRALIISVFGCMMPGTLVLFIGFFAILHSWLNAFAEMLRFADRLFYKDWWNSSSFSNYYRTWNVVVHDWLYSYIYREIYNLSGIRNRPAAMASVFLLSAVVHEYILTISLGFFYPVLFLLFTGAGFGFIFLPNKGAPRSGNVFIWVALFIGNGLLMCLYSMEWYARQNCKPTSDVWLVDQLFPRSWSCEYKGTTTVL